MPELKSLRREQREAIDAVTSFEMWHRLRELQGLNKKAATAIVTSFTYNPCGAITSSINPRGVETKRILNDLD